MAQSFKWSIYWEGFQLLMICMLPIRHLRISRRVNLFFGVMENVSYSYKLLGLQTSFVCSDLLSIDVYAMRVLCL